MFRDVCVTEYQLLGRNSRERLWTSSPVCGQGQPKARSMFDAVYTGVTYFSLYLYLMTWVHDLQV